MSDILQRAKAALYGTTPGPWWVSPEVDGINAERPTVVRAHAHPPSEAMGSLRVVTVGQTRMHFGSTKLTQGQDVANVAFIAKAPTLVAELIARIEELEKK